MLYYVPQYAFAPWVILHNVSETAVYGDIKKGVCRKGACKPPAPLALTYVDPEESLALTYVEPQQACREAARGRLGGLSAHTECHGCTEHPK